MLVVEVVRGLWVLAITTASRRELGIIPLLMVTVILVVEVVRGLRGCSITASKPVAVPLLDGIGGRRRDEPH